MDVNGGFPWVFRVKGENEHQKLSSVTCGSWFEESLLSLINTLVFKVFVSEIEKK